MRLLRSNPLVVLLVCVPAAFAAELTHQHHLLVFGLSLAGILPLAKLLGDGTEALAAHTGPRVGGLLNATLGNAAELIITLVALRAGLTELVKASITGSILGNLLLILGLALLLGGARHGLQRFDQREAGLAASQMTLALIALAIPTAFATAIEPNHGSVQLLSDAVALIMLAVYVLSIVYLLRSRPNEPPPPGTVGAHESGHWSVRTATAVLVGSTAALAALSEVLVGAVEPTIETLGWSEFFVGIILVPIVGNASEHIVAVKVAAQNQMDLAMNIAMGSSLQIALLVAPLLVMASLVLGPAPMSLVFNPFELAALGGATLIAAFIALDGESNWLEGVQLLAVYLILAVAFFFLPSAGG
jgi:Ca2+:H+ antiporter